MRDRLRFRYIWSMTWVNDDQELTPVAGSIFRPLSHTRGNMGWSFSGIAANSWRDKALAGYSGLWTPIQKFFSMKTQISLRTIQILEKMFWIQKDARLFSTRII